MKREKDTRSCSKNLNLGRYQLSHWSSGVGAEDIYPMTQFDSQAVCLVGIDLIGVHYSKISNYYLLQPVNWVIVPVTVHCMYLLRAQPRTFLLPKKTIP